MNLTDLLTLSRELIREAANFTNKELLLDYLNRFFKTGANLLNPISQSNDLVAINFSQVKRSYYLISIRNARFYTKPSSTLDDETDSHERKV